MKALLKFKIVEASPFKVHVLNMISHLNELEILNTSIYKESQVDIIL